MRRILAAILAVIAAGIFLIATLLAPENAGSRYWGSIAWLILLVAANLYTASPLFGSAGSTPSGRPGSLIGGLPAIGLAVFFYSLASAAVLLLFNLSLLSPNVHLSLQVLFGVIVVVTLLVLLLAVKGAGQGAESAVSQAEFLEVLQKLQRQNEDPEISDAILRQINYVSYQMPHPSKLDPGALKQAMRILRGTTIETAREDLSKFEQAIKAA